MNDIDKSLENFKDVDEIKLQRGENGGIIFNDDPLIEVARLIKSNLLKMKAEGKTEILSKKEAQALIKAAQTDSEF